MYAPFQNAFWDSCFHPMFTRPLSRLRPRRFLDCLSNGLLVSSPQTMLLRRFGPQPSANGLKRLRFSALRRVPGVFGLGPVFGHGRCTCGNERRNSEAQCPVHVKREGSTQLYSKFGQGSIPRARLCCCTCHQLFDEQVFLIVLKMQIFVVTIKTS